MFDTCPYKEEFDKAISEDKSNPPEQCKKCIIFKESEYHKREVDQERIELWKKMMMNN
ncbi:MAG: hypothetical protein HZB65_01215 [Candidatus Aenigmarchaeota archaeon]|nr:hypothetical protein [Candidatus Aenigmarchaeota archaeon]